MKAKQYQNNKQWVITTKNKAEKQLKPSKKTPIVKHIQGYKEVVPEVGV
jgi:chaperonin cofactor prefoldin